MEPLHQPFGWYKKARTERASFFVGVLTNNRSNLRHRVWSWKKWGKVGERRITDVEDFFKDFSTFVRRFPLHLARSSPPPIAEEVSDLLTHLIPFLAPSVVVPYRADLLSRDQGRLVVFRSAAHSVLCTLFVPLGM